MGSGELDFVTSYFRAKRIPCDGLDLLSTYGGEGGVGQHGRGFHEGYPDSYQGWNARKTYRRYNPKMFPNGGSDIEMLRERGFHPIVHGYWLADYSDPEATETYWQDHKFLIEDGWDGWWLDGMESVWDAADDRRVQHVPQDYLPSREKLETTDFRDEYDNIWALLRAKAFYEKQRRDFPDKRVYILNRTAFTGMQRYAAGVNQGDYWSNWDLLRVQLNWLLNMSMSGVLFPESDIGGFYPTEELTDELLIRWAFLATFQPLMRSHGCNWRCRLPWGFGPENEARFTRLIRLRYAMFPYNYTLLHQANQTGVPMMRPMVLEFPSDMETRQMSDQYMWGSHVLVAPVVEKGACERSVYLPDGKWVHSWSLRCYEGPGRVKVEAPLGQDPLFVRAGSVLPMCDPSDNIRLESEPSLTLLVLPGHAAAEFSLYDDDRQTYRYERDEFSLQTFSLSSLNASKEFALEVGAVEGRHAGIRYDREYRIEVPRSLAEVGRVIANGREIPNEVEGEPSTGDQWFVLPDRYVVRLDGRSGPFRVEFC
jgi:alpha-glucosidase (family GH31 glycosyl hydrolase)